MTDPDTKNPPRVTIVTAANPGAVGVVQLRGDGVERVLQTVTDGGDDWPVTRVRLVRFGDYDRGLAVRLRDDWAQLMPHGGPAVVRKLLDACLAAGATYDADPPARALFPEAKTELEADMLLTLSRAASPAAIDLLLAQPHAWETWLDKADAQSAAALERDADALLARAAVLHRLVEPPAVVVVGKPNVGKSTLTNCLLGRAASLVADLPGTTRDWVAGLVELSSVRGQVRSPQSTVRGREQPDDTDDNDRGDGERLRTADGGLGAESRPRTADRGLRTDSGTDIAVRWMDTPGLRGSDDAIEQEAIALANQVIAAADVLIAMRDPTTDWPAAAALPREPDLWVINKADLLPDAAPREYGNTNDTPRRANDMPRDDDNTNDAPPDADHADAAPGQSPDHPLLISAATGAGVAELQHAVLTRLALADLPRDAPWPFSTRLRELLTTRDLNSLREYIGAID